MLYREGYDPMVVSVEPDEVLPLLQVEQDAEDLLCRLLKKPTTGDVKQEATATEKA